RGELTAERANQGSGKWRQRLRILGLSAASVDAPRQAGRPNVSCPQRPWENNAAMNEEIPVSCEIDADRRFGGLARLYGPQAPGRLRAARVAVAGLGGVGSWTAEALARCGVGALTLVDLDHIAESNVNRQIHALTPTLGQAKIEAMAERIRGINPDCAVTLVDDFVEPGNVAQVFAGELDALVDCTDQAAAKIAMILH